MALFFTSSCAPFKYPCTVGQLVIDPCSCRSYWQCQAGKVSFVKRNCGNGTAWNHNTGFCLKDADIFIGTGIPICVERTPWQRCEPVKDPYSQGELRTSCLNGGTPTDPSDDSDSDSSSSTGAIVGGVIAGLVVIIVVVVLLLWWRKKQAEKFSDGDSNRPTPGFRPSLARKGNKEDEEEVYDVINEKDMQPTAISNEYCGKANEVAYDNPAFDKSHRKNDYTHFEDPNKLSPQSKDYNHLRTSGGSYADDDLSRSISVNGRDVMVEDQQGYHVGYPSGTVPRQPSPLPSPSHSPRRSDTSDVMDYDLATASGTPDYLELEKTDL